MSAISDAEYAILAAAAYRDMQQNAKDVRIPSGWTQVDPPDLSNALVVHY